MRISIQYRTRKNPETGIFDTEMSWRVVAKAENESELGKSQSVRLPDGQDVFVTAGESAKWFDARDIRAEAEAKARADARAKADADADTHQSGKKGGK